MDKKAIKNFAIESRKKLISEIKYKMGLLGITAEGIADPVRKAEGMEVYDIGAATPHTIYDEAIEQRKSLVKQIKEKGYENVVEEVAYTWFNRIIAIRFMEVNDYLPTRVKVLSSETKEKTEPDIVTKAPNIDLDFTDEEIEHIYQLKIDNKLDELFRLLFIKQCNKLNEILPELFEKTADYTELLLSISFTNEDGIVRHLIDNISEEDFKYQVEIIGWLYQYYNTELKEKTFKELKKGVKISKEKIPAATQLFTPDWIVRYMVENSLGRLWLEGHPNSELKKNWKYYLDEAEQEPEVQIELIKIQEDSKNLKPEDIKIIDPAVGSGHILVYAFEVLMQIYTSVGYSEKDATESILKNNLYGLDIDDRAYQLAYFAVMMKARSYSRRILTKNIEPQICAIQESNEISDELINFVADGNLDVENDLKYLKNLFKDSKQFGSIIDVKKCDFDKIKRSLDVCLINQSNLLKTKFMEEAHQKIIPLLKQAIILSESYEIVVTNPPYMGGNGMNKTLNNYLKNHYPNTKKDLFATFIEKGLKLTKKNMFNCMVTMQSWMFLSSFEKMRENIFKSSIITNLLHMENMVMGIAFGTSATVFRKLNLREFRGTYNQIKLKDITKLQTPIKFPNPENRNNYVSAENFSQIPESPIAYWINKNLITAFSKGNRLSSIASPRQGLASGNNDFFVRLWFEVDINQIGFETSSLEEFHNKGFKYALYNKGGKFRKWYGNNEFLIKFDLVNYEKLSNMGNHLPSKKFYFKEGGTWTAISSGAFSVRYFPKGYTFSNAGMAIFGDNETLLYLISFLNSNLTKIFLSIFNEGLNYNQGDIAKLPIIFDKNESENILKICEKNIQISKLDWDNFEESWDFSKHPLIKYNEKFISESFLNWKIDSESNYNNLKENEEKLNEIFIKIYDLDDLTPEVPDKAITIRKANLNRDIKSFISYVVGCMLGRYSLDKEGLIYAGGPWNPKNYSKFIPDEDNIIPILDTEYFEDDIVGRFIEFVKVTFGEETLEENLDFIASALKKKGTTSREIIRNYFLTDFYKDHVKTYKKRPIYWQFESGKNNGFKALIYMHRYEPDLVARVRTDYLHKTQKAIETAINQNERIIKNSKNASEKSKAVKTKNKLVKQLEETRKYDEALAHVANQKIEIDLDDGVKVNYAKFQGVEVSKEGKKSKKIDLLKKI